MTVAVIIATRRAGGGPAGARPAAVLPYRPEPDDAPTLLARLCDQLTTLNVPDVQVIGRPELASPLRADGHFVTESGDVAGDLREIARLARLARLSGEPVVVLPADLIASDALLERLVNGPAKGPGNGSANGLATGPANGSPGGPVNGYANGAGAPMEAVTVPPVPEGAYGMTGVRARKGRLDVPSAKPNAAFPGVLRFEPSQAVAVAEVAERLARSKGPAAEEPGEVAETLLEGLVRFGVGVAECPSRGLVCRRAADDDQVRAARTELETVDDDRARLAAAVKGEDGFFTTFAVSSYSPYIVRRLAARGVTPNTVTVVSMVLAALAAMWFAAGTRAGMVTGAVLFYCSFVLDCVDGQLARYTGRLTGLGAWLDAVSDRAKEYVVYAGLALGSTAAAAGGSVHGGDVWGLAVAALILQTVRHMVDFSYQVRGGGGGEPAAGPPADPVARLSRRTSRVTALHWAKKILVLPIGERFALIALTAALFNARVTFTALLIWGGIAAAYTLTGRLLRSVAPKPSGASPPQREAA